MESCMSWLNVFSALAGMLPSFILSAIAHILRRTAKMSVTIGFFMNLEMCPRNLQFTPLYFPVSSMRGSVKNSLQLPQFCPALPIRSKWSFHSALPFLLALPAGSAPFFLSSFSFRIFAQTTSIAFPCSAW